MYLKLLAEIDISVSVFENKGKGRSACKSLVDVSLQCLYNSAHHEIAAIAEVPEDHELIKFRIVAGDWLMLLASRTLQKKKALAYYWIRPIVVW